jgi:hypothetical protein
MCQYRLKATDSRLLAEPRSSLNGHSRELSLRLFFCDFGSSGSVVMYS